MKKLLFALLLTGCGCAQQPIMPEAQSQMQAMATGYSLAHMVEQRFCVVGPFTQPCYNARKSGYDVEAAIATANTERTESAIAEARRKLIGYQTAIEQVL